MPKKKKRGGHRFLGNALALLRWKKPKASTSAQAPPVAVGASQTPSAGGSSSSSSSSASSSSSSASSSSSSSGGAAGGSTTAAGSSGTGRGCGKHDVLTPAKEAPSSKRKSAVRSEMDFGSPGGGGALRKSPRKKAASLEFVVGHGYCIMSDLDFARTHDGRSCENPEKPYCRGALRVINCVHAAGAMAPTLYLWCAECFDMHIVRAGEKVRLFASPGSDKLRLPIDRTSIMWFLGVLFAGQTFSTQKRLTDGLGLSQLTETTFKRYLSWVAPFVRSTTERSMELLRRLKLKYHERGWMTTADAFWAYRGHHSKHGTATITDLDSAGVLFRQHLTKDLHAAVAGHIDYHSGTSGAMDAEGYKRNLEVMKKWMAEIAPVIIKELGLPEGDVKHLYAVLDGDATSQDMLSQVFSDTIALLCWNHLCKNASKNFDKVAKEKNKTCSCLVKKKKDGSTYKTGQRAHRVVDAALTKKVQVSETQQYCMRPLILNASHAPLLGTSYRTTLSLPIYPPAPPFCV